jgi:membrane fusion protein (multidrug efflux system)
MNKSVTSDDLGSAREVSMSPARTTQRKKLFAGLAGAVVLAGAGFGVYQGVVASKHAVTDNAYVEAETAQVTALTSGPVAEVRVVDAQAVKKGDVLVVLDSADRRLELEQAQAALAQAERQVRGYQATDTALDGQIGARRADLARARADLVRISTQYDRRAPLSESGAISAEELTSAKTALDSARAVVAQAEANLRAAEGDREANLVRISGVSLEQNPEVTAARFRVEQAQVALDRTVVRAPVDGIVTKRTVQIGQMVQPGTLMLNVVPVQQAYVMGNFKEGQLAKVRVGQPVELESDLYGKHVVYHGRVLGFSGGTGAAMAVVPAQNATGNWIKVVQRLPVRIALDPKELQAHPLKVGLSMTADIDVSR